jgi:Condensation domain
MVFRYLQVFYRHHLQRMGQLVPVSRKAPLVLSFAQETIWPHCQKPATNTALVKYKIDQIYGPLDVEALHSSLNFIVRRHEILRTTFAKLNGQPVQIVQPAEAISLPILKIAPGANPTTEAARILEQHVSEISVTQGPLIRFSLLRINEKEHWLLYTCHLLLWDQWTNRLFRNELALLYETQRERRPPPVSDLMPSQYADYAVWQRKRFSPNGPVYQEAVAWWKERFEAEPAPVELPFKRPVRLPELDPSEGQIDWFVDSELRQRVTWLCRFATTTQYVVWLATLVALLAAETGQPDIVVGTYMSGRRNYPAAQSMMGNFINLVALPFHYLPTKTFREWLAEVGLLVTEAQARCEIPHEQLRHLLQGLGVAVPEVRVIFGAPMNMRHLHVADLTLCTGSLRSEAGMPWGFSITVSAHKPQLCWFNAEIYDPVAVRRFLGRLCELLDVASRHPDLPVGDLISSLH